MCQVLIDFSIELQKRRERGRISIRGIRLVEIAALNLDGGDSSVPEVSRAATPLPAMKSHPFAFSRSRDTHSK